MTKLKPASFKPSKENHQIYAELYKLYHQLHDAFGMKEHKDSLYNVMKSLLDIKERVVREYVKEA